jgi:hypothetical protein
MTRRKILSEDGGLSNHGVHFLRRLALCHLEQRPAQQQQLMDSQAGE